MLGACLILGNYHNLLDQFEGGYNRRTFGLPTSTATLFFTAPQPYMSNIGEQQRYGSELTLKAPGVPKSLLPPFCLRASSALVTGTTTPLRLVSTVLFSAS